VKEKSTKGENCLTVFFTYAIIIHEVIIMARKKKIPLPKNPNYTGLGRLNKEPTDWVVQKSDPLQSLSATDLTLPEFKILDVYLSRIDSHAPDKRYVRFEKGEIEKLLGVDRIRKDELSKRLDNLFTAVTLHDENKPKGFIKIGLFAKAEANVDDDGLWQIDLACTTEAMEYIFNIENLGYIRYKLRNVINLTSRYSYILFSYLLDNRYRKTWEISLSELKSLLACTAESYSEFKLFNDRILKKCKAEINAKTDINFDYFTVKKGRKVTDIRFEIETMDKTEQLEEQVTFDELSTPQVDDEEHWIEIYGSERLAILAEGCNYEFDKSQMEQISCVLTRIHIPKEANTNDLTFGRLFYLKEKYSALNAEVAKKKFNGEKNIKNRFRYFLKMLEQDTFQPVAYTE
jgi:plasmid replication initiation protein